MGPVTSTKNNVQIDKHGTQMTRTNSFATCHQRIPLETIQLQNIDTGITAGDSVNADQAVSVGRKILDGMVDKKVFDHTFKQKDQVVTFGTRSSVKTGKESVLIDPQLLFQRLIGLQDHAVMTSLMSSSTNYAVTHQHCFRPVIACLKPISQR